MNTLDTLTRLAILVALTAGIALSGCGDDKKKGDDKTPNENRSALHSPSSPDPEPPSLPHGDISYACSNVASAAGVSDPLSWQTDCIEVVSMAYRMCGSDGDLLVQCVNASKTGDDMAACLAACE